ncbi:hypothetical protein Clacol_009777 [Clathrus columnatus]|uniref:Beta-hexosaminidase n=1 Tax=Clathrus columnatus TaxID=1419009 RepID=A0AAV5AQR5_9AGAM|nr:hypothetical protein Clacol_009777 [Clathrus columnatus]
MFPTKTILLRILFTFLTYIHGTLCLWPMPSNLNAGSSLLRLSPEFSIVVDVQDAPSDLTQAVQRATTYIQQDKLQRLVVGRGATDAQSIAKAPGLSKLTLSLTGKRPTQSISTEAISLLEDRSESYSLTVPADGSSATLTADSTLGLFRGLTTFGQLWYQYQNTIYAVQTPLTIENDTPAFPYRGFMLDTSRNFFPVSDILRTMDAMSWVKTDTHSWPLFIESHPELSAEGAYTSDSQYSQADIQNITSYAAEEIDTPSHTGSISFSHPELVACSDASPWSTFASEPPAGQLRLASPAGIDLATSIFSSAASIFPSKYISTGGDELNANCYDDDAETQAELKASGQTLEEALDTFVQATQSTLTKVGKIPIISEEMVLDYNLTLSNDTIAIVWISSQDVPSVVQRGFRVILGASDFLFLVLNVGLQDCGGGEWVGDDIANSWCDPFKTWQKIYSFDPFANLTSEQTKLIVGGMTLLWTEQSDPSNLDPIVWPRAAAAAEVFWTGAQLPTGTPLNSSEALPRLHDARYRFVQRGVKAIALQPQWCALRPGACDLNA